MRKLGIAVAVIVVLVIVALLVVPHFINVNNYRGQIQAELQKRLGRPVTLGNMHLGLLPPAFTVDNATIAEDPRFGSQPFATVQELAVKAKL
jgi:AsmA protein